MGDTTIDSSRKGGSVRSTLAKKVLMPLVATAASAAASYVAKKAPRYLEETVLPKLRETANGAGSVAHDLPERAKSVASSAGDVAQDLPERAKSVASSAGEVAQNLTERAKSVATHDSPSKSNGGGERARAKQVLTSSERERQRSERAKHRAARRKTSTS
jgi:hypothetical protein